MRDGTLRYNIFFFLVKKELVVVKKSENIGAKSTEKSL